ncbi:MAG: hypothetical protein ACP5U2_08350 [Bryobacteraceae bacterium]
MTRVFVLAAVLATAILAQKPRTFTGVITCTMCKNDHRAMEITPEDRCVRECIKHGAKYALWDGKNLYRLSDQQTPEKFAARKVRVTGVLYEKTGIIRMHRIEPLQEPAPPSQGASSGHRH